MKFPERRQFMSIAKNEVRLLGFAFVLASVLVLLAAAPAVHAQTFSVIHAFTGGWDGADPQAGVVIRGGDLFGTASAGGLHFWGMVFQAKRSADNNWSIVPLSYLPISGNDPGSRTLFGPDGLIYGTTFVGGPNRHGNVYTLTPPVTATCPTIFCPWLETEIHNFSGTDGDEPTNGDLVWDQQGNIFGTTYGGGQHGLGTVFEMMRSGNGWVTTPIYSFSGSDGSNPAAGVAIDANGNLFGTTTRGGANDLGVVYELKYMPGMGWQQTILHDFQNGDDGALPFAGLIFDQSGNLYGGAIYGGSAHGGTIFELSPSGNAWTFNLVYSLSGSPDEGCGPQTSLAFDTAGNLLGTTPCGGSYDKGTVFRLTKTNNSWGYTELHSFNPDTDGSDPICTVAIDSDGTLYGTTEASGPYSRGTLWMIKP